jgi:glycosyltransferase involved in cell wall biosynthesis
VNYLAELNEVIDVHACAASGAELKPTAVRNADMLVFAPTYNEGDSIGSLLDRLLVLQTKFDILIVDDGSSDGTPATIAAYAARNPRIRLIERSGKLGIGSAHRLAWRYARRLAAYGVRALRAGAAALPSRAALADWTVLLLAPLPFSPWLEPYHAVPLVVGAVLLLAIVLDDRVASRDRGIALAAILGLGLLGLFPLPFTMRGIILLASFLVLIGALTVLRAKLSSLPLSQPRSEQ